MSTTLSVLTAPAAPVPGKCTSEAHTASDFRECEKGTDLGVGILVVGAVALVVVGLGLRWWLQRRFSRTVAEGPEDG